MKKNIETVMSSGNGQNVGNYAEISINYDTLDENNQKICQQLIAEKMIKPLKPVKTDHVFNQFAIATPVTPETTVGEVSQQLLTLAENFQTQDILYGRQTIQAVLDYLYDENTLTINHNHHTRDLLKIENGTIDIDDLVALAINETRYKFYDPVEQVFWENASLCQRHQQYQLQHTQQAAQMIN